MKHWVFDLDGTLVNSLGFYEKAIARIFADFGLQCGPDDLTKAHQFFNPHDFFSLYLKTEFDVQLALRKLLQINMEDFHHINAFVGVEPLIRKLAAQNIKLSVWTGRDRNSAVKILEYNKIRDYFDLCVSRTCVAQTKPKPDGLIKILSESKSHVNDVAMVGDHAYDIQGARAVGVKAISVSWVHNLAENKHPLDGQSDNHFYEIPVFESWALKHYT